MISLEMSWGFLKIRRNVFCHDGAEVRPERRFAERPEFGAELEINFEASEWNWSGVGHIILELQLSWSGPSLQPVDFVFERPLVTVLLLNFVVVFVDLFLQ